MNKRIKSKLDQYQIRVFADKALVFLYDCPLFRLTGKLNMMFPAQHTIVVCILLLFCGAAYTQSQTRPANQSPAGSISGKVTIKGKGFAGIAVVLRTSDFAGPMKTSYRGITDQDGNYRIAGVTAGTYFVIPAAPAFVVGELTDSRGKSLIVAEGESVDGINFNLTPGGVITGKVTDTEGRPLIEEPISLLPADTDNQRGQMYGTMVRPGQTDDRGVYRIFGLAAGRYKVAVGQSEDFVGGPRKMQYRQTFHPAVTDSTKATIVEITEGSEASNIDITVGRSLTTFTASGRVVDGETGQPLTGITLGVQGMVGDRISSGAMSSTSNSQGGFRLENLAPGKYSAFIIPRSNSEIRADPVTFEIVDGDVTDLLLKGLKGASVSGVIALEGTDDKSVVARLSQLRVNAYVQSERPGSNYGQSATTNQDGSFRVGGLAAGTVNFSLSSTDRRPLKGFTLIRVEREGVLQPRGLEIKDGEQVSGVRLIVSYANGGIRGTVKFENGEPPSDAQLYVAINRLLEDSGRTQTQFTRPVQVDARGHFLVEGLAAGTYEVNVNLFTRASRVRPPTAKQQVTVADGSVTDVTVTLDLQSISAPGNP